MIVELHITFSNSLDFFVFISLYMNYEVVLLNKILIYFVKKKQPLRSILIRLDFKMDYDLDILKERENVVRLGI